MPAAAQKTASGRSRERLGGDYARVWVRKIRLGNPYAKSVMLALANYMNEDGSAWPGMATLSSDTDISEDTVVSRLRWCESIGLIAMFKAWVDEHGRRNHEGRGRPTSSEIRFLFDADTAQIEINAAGSIKARPLVGAARLSHETKESDSSRQQREQTDEASSRQEREQNEVSTGLAPDQPPPPSARTEELEDNPPNPPEGGVEIDIGDQESETKIWPHIETWARFETGWQEPILHQQLCRQIWSAFTDAERKMAIKVARGYRKWLASQKRPPNSCNPQKILRERDAWPQFSELAGPDPLLRTFIVKDSPAHQAILVLAKIGAWLPPEVHFDMQQAADGYWRDYPPPADLLGLAVFADKPIEEWTVIEPNTKPFIAWSGRIHDWLGRWPETLRVPCLFPPRKDGSIGSSPEANNQQSNFSKAG